MDHLRTTSGVNVRTFIGLALACLLPAAFSPAQVPAACPSPPASSLLGEGEVGLFFDPAGTVTCADVTVGVFKTLYLVARVPEGGVASYTISELLAAGGVLITTGTIPTGTGFSAHIYIDACNVARRIDPQSCPVARGDLLVLAMYQVMFFVTEGQVDFLTACPTLAGMVQMNPQYTRCDTGAWGEFTGGESMSLFLGGVVSVDSGTWGRIKSLYAGD